MCAEWGIFYWKSETEKKRLKREEDKMDELEDPSKFDALQMCGHRSASDMLPTTELLAHLAFELADQKMLDWRRIMRTWTEFDIYEAFAHRRTCYYTASEETDEDEDDDY